MTSPPLTAAELSATNCNSPSSPTGISHRRTTPWAEVVRGPGDPSESASPPPDAVECSTTAGENSDVANTANAGKKPPWNKASNGVSSDNVAVTSAANSSVVIGGATAWPALSESTRNSQKSSTPESSKSVSEGSQAPVNSHSQEYEQGYRNAGAHRSRMVRRGGGGGNRHGSFPRASLNPIRPPVFPVPEIAQNSFNNVLPVAAHDISSREPRPNDYHTNHRGRRANFGQNNRGDARNNYRGGRRDQELISSQTHPHYHMPPPMAFVRPHAPPFPVSPTFRPYGNAVAYPDVPHVFYYPMPPDSIRGMPYFHAPPPSPHVVAEPSLQFSIAKQIDYYFSDANLVKDEYLRKNMDENGWVNITLIASFPRVKILTDNIPLILQCLSKSASIVEVQGDKVRRRKDWRKWLAQNQFSSNYREQNPGGSTDDILATSLQNATLEEEIGKS